MCFSKDKETAVVTTKEEAEKHKKNINEYVNERTSDNMVVQNVFRVESGGLSTAYDSFEDAYPQLFMMHQRFYIIINGKEQLLKDKPGDPYYRDQFGTNPLIARVKYGINTKNDSHLLMTDGDLALVLDGGYPRFVYTRDDLFRALDKIYA